MSAIIENTNTRSQDYEGLRHVPRPGHADYAAYVRYGNHHDVAGGGHFSGRLTAPLCIAGGIALQALEQALGIRVVAHIAQLGPERICDERLNDMTLDPSQVEAIGANELPCISTGAARAMHEAVLAAKSKLDSVGGVRIGCVAYGMPAAVERPDVRRAREPHCPNRLRYPSRQGRGVWREEFGAAALLGSQNNDPYRIEDDARRV